MGSAKTDSYHVEKRLREYTDLFCTNLEGVSRRILAIRTNPDLDHRRLMDDINQARSVVKLLRRDLRYRQSNLHHNWMMARSRLDDALADMAKPEFVASNRYRYYFTQEYVLVSLVRRARWACQSMKQAEQSYLASKEPWIV